jgi:hypothetical protein
VLAWSVGGYGPTLDRVVKIDVAALAICVVGLAAHMAGARKSERT